ncbi:MAG: hypothetical protein IKT09_05090 [Synergistes sp.]|nr:hypothetical protein [Synergistes sp.]
MIKKVYIAHPLRGEKPYTEDQCRKNTQRVTKICNKIFSDFTDVIPISPVHAFSFVEPLGCDQRRVLDCCSGLLDACCELWVFGDDWTSSEGCVFEFGEFCRRNKGLIAFCEFDEETRQIKRKAEFDLSRDRSDLVSYVLDLNENPFAEPQK